MAGMSTVFREFRVASWDEFLRLITSAPYSNWAFRGERHAKWPLHTSLSRYFTDFGVHAQAWPEQEGRILRIFKRKAHQYLQQPPGLNDDFQWLALMQHHGHRHGFWILRGLRTWPLSLLWNGPRTRPQCGR
jgi:hypothetical protein